MPDRIWRSPIRLRSRSCSVLSSGRDAQESAPLAAPGFFRKASAEGTREPSRPRLPRFLLGHVMPGRVRFPLREALTLVNILFTKGGVIRSFTDSETERFFVTGKPRRLPRDILKRAAMRLKQLDAAVKLEDLRLPPSNQLEALKGDLAGRHSIRINKQWRLCFRFVTGDAFDVEIVDYH